MWHNAAVNFTVFFEKSTGIKISQTFDYQNKFRDAFKGCRSSWKRHLRHSIAIGTIVSNAALEFEKAAHATQKLMKLMKRKRLSSELKVGTFKLLQATQTENFVMKNFHWKKRNSLNDVKLTPICWHYQLDWRLWYWITRRHCLETSAQYKSFY